ncbi:UNVERIFIED_CONTAM: hypothetical protein Sradi_4097800 [Sesamum radiatum]|uniref:Uncharacterized protein n=1 Tax=Sesamum radiatum TaxID=300843 RepID=A0AAW2P1Z4_SESRA
MIARGPTDGDSRRARRAYARVARIFMEIDDKAPAGGPVIYFDPVDIQGVHLPYNDALVIYVIVANYIVQSIFVDSSSSTDVLFYKVYQQMELGDIPLELVDTSLYDLVGEAIVSTYHMKLKFPIGDNVEEIKGDQYTTRKCYVEAIKSSNNKNEVDLSRKESSRNSTQQEDQRGVVPARVQPAEELLSIYLVPGESNKITKIGSQLNSTLAG